jgi:hypothetical protein
MITMLLPPIFAEFAIAYDFQRNLVGLALILQFEEFLSIPKLLTSQLAALLS